MLLVGEKDAGRSRRPPANHRTLFLFRPSVGAFAIVIAALAKIRPEREDFVRFLLGNKSTRDGRSAVVFVVDVANRNDDWIDFAADQLRLISGTSRVTMFRVL
jgi:hypothetical protein